MQSQFFPNIGFCWTFIVLLTVLLAAAAYSDLKTAVIPKSLSLTTAALGILMSVMRCAWLARDGQRAWFFSEPGPVLGAADGLLFSLAGFVLGFILFTCLWILGVCGGGDVKLFAALGTWIGPMMCVYVLAVTLVLISVIILAQALLTVFSGNWKQMRARKPRANGLPPKRRLITFGLPLTVATLVVLAWKLRIELNLVPAPPAVFLLGGFHAN